MSAFRLKFLRKGVAGPGGGGTLTPLFYDSRFGTAIDSQGMITFGLKSGCRRVWVNGGAADDTGTGLSAASPKKTLAAGITVWLNGSYTAGDQLMLAEGYTYTDPGSSYTWTGFGGFSLAYPQAVLSYDPADDANSTKYGKALGSNQPVINVSDPTASSSCFSALTSSGNGFYAMQGILFSSSLTADGRYIQFLKTGAYGTGVCFQNCRFHNTPILLQTNDASTHLVSKCAFVGAWASTNGVAALIGDRVDGCYFQDCVFYHNGWKIGASRNDSVASGGTGFLQHDAYFHASNTNGRFDRCVHIDCANDGLNIRGSATATQDVAWDVPIAFTLGGFSSSSSEAPSGVITTLQDGLIIGGARINDSGGYQRNWGVQAQNNLSGSFVKNVAAFDSPYHTDTAAVLLYVKQGIATIPSQAILIDGWRSFNYADHFVDGDGDAALHPSITNSYVDSLTNYTAPSVITTGTSIHSGATTYPSALTRAQFASALCTALGLTPSGTYNTDKGTLVNLMIYRPDIQWAPIMHAIGLPSLGAASTFAAVTPPNLSAVSAPSIYV